MLVTKESNFNEDGLKICIISGVHGNESHAVKACYEFHKYCESGEWNNPEGLKNIKWILNFNEYGLVNEQRNNNYEKDETKDINRLFPREFYTVNEIKERLERLRLKFDIVIDVHNSPYCIPCVLLDYDKKVNKLLTHIEGCRLNKLVRHTNIGTIKKYFNNSTEAYTLELPGMGIEGDWINSFFLLRDFIETIIKNYNNEEREWDIELPIDLYTTVEQGIIYWPQRQPTKRYKKDEIIAQVEDIYNGEMEEIKAPFDGILYDINESVYVSNLNSIGLYGKEIK